MYKQKRESLPNSNKLIFNRLHLKWNAFHFVKLLMVYYNKLPMLFFWSKLLCIVALIMNEHVSFAFQVATNFRFFVPSTL